MFIKHWFARYKSKQMNCIHVQVPRRLRQLGNELQEDARVEVGGQVAQHCRFHTRQEVRIG